MKCFTHEEENCPVPQCKARLRGCQRPACVREMEDLIRANEALQAHIDGRVARGQVETKAELNRFEEFAEDLDREISRAKVRASEEQGNWFEKGTLLGLEWSSKRPPMARVSEAEVEQAKSVLYRHYRDWVDSEVDGLVSAIFDNEVTDAESLRDRMEQDTDSSLVYTYDQHMVLFASESTDEGQQNMEDMGGGGDNMIAVWAFLTYQVDVLDALDRVGLGGDFDREEWIRETVMSTPELAVKWDRHLERGGADLED